VHAVALDSEYPPTTASFLDGCGESPPGTVCEIVGRRTGGWEASSSIAGGGLHSWRPSVH
jgi:hypothetical protein